MFVSGSRSVFTSNPRVITHGGASSGRAGAGGGEEGGRRGGVTNSFTKTSGGVWRTEDLLQEEPEKKVWPGSSADQRRHGERHGRPGATDQRREEEKSPGSAAQHPARSTAGESAESWRRESILPAAAAERLQAVDGRSSRRSSRRSSAPAGGSTVRTEREERLPGCGAPVWDGCSSTTDRQGRQVPVAPGTSWRDATK